MRKFGISLLSLSLLVACKKTSLFTEIDASFKSLDEVYIDEFKNEHKQVEKNSERPLDAKEALTGRYGTQLTLDIWEFGSDEDCKKAYEGLVQTERNDSPREYDQTRSKEYRYTFTRGSGVAGEIFTVKKLLLRFLGENKDTIREYLVASKLGRIR